MGKRGPGKFRRDLDAALHAVSLDGCDDEAGDVSEGGLHVCKLTGSDALANAVVAEHQEFDEGEWADLCKLVKGGAIVTEDDQGFVEVEIFADDDKAEKVFAKAAKDLED